MKRLRLSNLVCAAALVIVVGSAVGASDQPTQTPVQNRAEKWPIVLVQNAFTKQKGNERAKVNVDSKGGYLKGIRCSRLHQRRKAGQRDSRNQEQLSGRYLLIRLCRG